MKKILLFSLPFAVLVYASSLFAETRPSPMIDPSLPPSTAEGPPYIFPLPNPYLEEKKPDVLNQGSGRPLEAR